MRLELAGVAEVQVILGITTRQQAVQVTQRPDFPEPVANLRSGRIWLVADVVAFSRTWRRQKGIKAKPPAS